MIMTTQDMINAINESIADNNVKAINAATLRNVLTMLAENAGQGSSSEETLRLLLPSPNSMILSGMFAGEFTPAIWQEVLTQAEAENPGFSTSELAQGINAAFENNAQLYQKLLNDGRAGLGKSVLIDFTPLAMSELAYMPELDPEAGAVYANACMSMTVQAQMTLLEDIPAIGESVCHLGDQRTIVCVLAADGGVQYAGSIFGVEITVPENNNVTLTDDDLADNALIVKQSINLANLFVTAIPVYKRKEDVSQVLINGILYNISNDTSLNNLSFNMLDGTTCYHIVIAEDGSATMTQIGSFAAE